MNAVSESANWSSTGTGIILNPLTMPGVEAPEVVCYTVQVETVWRDLRAWVVRGRDLARVRLVRAGWERRRQEVRQVEAAEREVDVGLDLVGERALEGEALEVDEEDGREAGDG